MPTDTHRRNLIARGLTCFILLAIATVPVNASRPDPIVTPGLITAKEISSTPVEIPLSLAPVTIDGTCHPSEWSSGLRFTYADGGIVDGGAVTLQQDGANLNICVTGKQGTQQLRFFRAYFDTDFGQETNAQSEDIGLEIDIETNSGFTSSYRGNGSGNYKMMTGLSGWTAAVTTSPESDTAEYQIPLSLTGGGCGTPFGIAVFHHWFDSSLSNYGWPTDQWYYAPNTWQAAIIPNRSCLYLPLSLK